MNVAEVYTRKLNQSLIIEIHIVDNINFDVKLHNAADIEKVKQDAINHWRDNSYDHEGDDTQIWDTTGHLIWSYNDHWGHYEDINYEREANDGPDVDGDLRQPPNHDFFNIMSRRYDQLSTLEPLYTVEMPVVDIDSMTTHAQPQEDTSGDDRDPFA